MKVKNFFFKIYVFCLVVFLLCVFLISCVALTGGEKTVTGENANSSTMTTTVIYKDDKSDFEIIKEQYNSEVYRINNIVSHGNFAPLEQFAADHPIGFDLEKAKNSINAVHQVVHFFDKTSNDDKEKYFSAYTTAYHTGFAPGKLKGSVYEIETELVFYKPFKMRNEDVFTFTYDTSKGAFNSEIDEKCTIFYSDNSGDHSKEMRIEYNGANLRFRVQWPKNTLNNKSSNWSLKANYSIVTNYGTYVNINYIHNEKILGDIWNRILGRSNIILTGSRTAYIGAMLMLYNLNGE